MRKISFYIFTLTLWVCAGSSSAYAEGFTLTDQENSKFHVGELVGTELGFQKHKLKYSQQKSTPPWVMQDGYLYFSETNVFGEPYFKIIIFGGAKNFGRSYEGIWRGNGSHAHGIFPKDGGGLHYIILNIAE